MANLATIELDTQWLRRIRGKLTSDELQRAKDLADEDVKQFIRELYGSQSDDEDLEIILDDDGEPVDVGSEVIADLFHETSGALDRLTHEYYARFKTLADNIASHYCIQWGDFMGQSEDSEDSTQQRAVGSNINRMKTQIESIGFVRLTAAADNANAVRYFQRNVMIRNGIKVRRSERR